MGLEFPEVSLNQVQAVLIDLDNTLYHYEPNHQMALDQCAQVYRGQLNANDFKSIYRQKRNEVTERLKPQGACRSRLFAFQALLEDEQYSSAYIHALELENIYWDSFLSTMQIDPKALNFLNKCKDQSVPVNIVTDMTAAIQIRKIKSLKIEELVTYLTTSEEAGAEKPSPLIFKRALDKLKVKAEETIMIGDSSEKDIAGANQLGIPSFLVQVNN